MYLRRVSFINRLIRFIKIKQIFNYYTRRRKYYFNIYFFRIIGIRTYIHDLYSYIHFSKL